MTDSNPNISLKRPDKVVAGILAAIAIVGLGGLLYVALPYLIALATNTIIFVAELAVLAVLGIVLLDKGTWISIIYKWKNMSRNIRRKIAADDPIGTLSTVIQRFEDKMEEIGKYMDNAQAAWRRQCNSIAECRKKETNELNSAKAAEKSGYPQAVVERHAIAAKRWGDAAAEMQPLADLLQQTTEKMKQAKDVCSVRLEDMQNQKEVLRMKLDAMKAGQAAVKSFKRFFSSNPDLEMLTLSVEAIEEQSTQAEAEIDGFLQNIQPLVEANNVQKQADAIAAMDQFNKHFLSASTETKAQPLLTAPVTVKVEGSKK